MVLYHLAKNDVFNAMKEELQRPTGSQNKRQPTIHERLHLNADLILEKRNPQNWSDKAKQSNIYGGCRQMGARKMTYDKLELVQDMTMNNTRKREREKCPAKDATCHVQYEGPLQ